MRISTPRQTSASAPAARRAVLDSRRIRLAHRIASRLDGRLRADAATLEAVTRLTDAADPARADRLRPRSGEPAALVERLAVWALFGADDLAVAGAERALSTADAGIDADETITTAA